jgi:ABC-type uncharacterized transport system permease subunit
MILLYVVVAALYAAATWAGWPGRGTAPAIRIGLVALALALHGVAAIAGVARPDGLDVSLAQALSIVAWLTVVVALATRALVQLPSIGGVVLPVAALAALLPALWPSDHRFPYSDQPWATAHIAIALLAYAFVIVAAAQALVMTGLEKRLHRGHPDQDAPPLLTLERALFRLIGVGFALLTLALASGALFSEHVFGRAFQFTHKNLFAVASWALFGALIVGRWRFGWRGRRALHWILAGTALLVVAYLGTKFVLQVLLGR